MWALTKDCTRFSFNAGAHTGAQNLLWSGFFAESKAWTYHLWARIFFMVKAILFSKHWGLLKFDIPVDKFNLQFPPGFNSYLVACWHWLIVVLSHRWFNHVTVINLTLGTPQRGGIDAVWLSCLIYWGSVLLLQLNSCLRGQWERNCTHLLYVSLDINISLLFSLSNNGLTFLTPDTQSALTAVSWGL